MNTQTDTQDINIKTDKVIPSTIFKTDLPKEDIQLLVERYFEEDDFFFKNEQKSK